MTDGTKPVEVEVQTATREQDGKPFVRFSIGGRAILMDLDEARALGNLILTFAAIAEQDAVLVNAAVTVGVTGQELVEAVVAERQRRKGPVH